MQNFRNNLKHQWQKPSGYKEVLYIAFPLILSTGSWSLQHFIDRMFLTWYSSDAIAAAMPAGILNFTLMSLFIGTVSYVSTFVAQYKGAGQPEKIGQITWQAIYISILGGIILLGFIPVSEIIFSFAGHPPAVAKAEVIYFNTLCFGAIPAIMASAISGFYAGIGKTWPVMWVNIMSTLINIGLDYLMIFGKGIIPPMGIKGAAIATNMSALFTILAYSLLFIFGNAGKEYSILRYFKPRLKLALRLIRFGGQSGIQFFSEVAGFTIFILMIGKIGTNELAASNIAFSINTFSFMPMIGIGIAASTLVGQNLGKNDIETAVLSVRSALHITLFYMLIIISLFLFFPSIFIAPFIQKTIFTGYEEIASLTKIMLRFIAFYTLFDALNILFSSAIKGAGDTRFVMFTFLFLAILVLIIPTYVLIIKFNYGIFTAWYIASFYIGLLGLIFYLRYKSGKWKNMRVIEDKIVL